MPQAELQEKAEQKQPQADWFLSAMWTYIRGKKLKDGRATEFSNYSLRLVLMSE